MRLFIVVAVFVILAILHQDFWNWGNRDLWLGFIPAGLAYHSLYSLVAATFWLLVIKFAWPAHIEEWAEESDTETEA